MQEEIIIVSFHETYTADGGSHTINHFKSRKNAADFITVNIEADESRKETILTELKARLQQTLFQGKPGNYQYTDGDHEISIAWDNVPTEYRVSNEELYYALDGYVNSNRSQSEYKTFAEHLTSKMHRYCQNELFKLIYRIIRAFADAPYDERNKPAHDKCQKISAFVENNFDCM